MSVTLYILRHGNTFNPGEKAVQIGRATDLPLTERGQDQARLMVSLLKDNDIKLSAVYCSNLKRQKETAEIISKGLGDVALVEHESLAEIDYGAWEGLSVEELKSKYLDEYNAWNQWAVWAKSFASKEEHCLIGISNFLSDLTEKHKDGETVLAVSSNGLIRQFYRYRAEEWEKYRRNKALGELKVGTGHFCRLQISGGDIEVDAWNRNPGDTWV